MEPVEAKDSSFLDKFDLRLAEDESLRHHFDPKKGAETEPAKIRRGFMLTNRRLFYVEREWWGRAKSKAAFVNSIDYLEVQHTPRPISTLVAALFMFVAGVYLAGASLALSDADMSARSLQIPAALLLVGAVAIGIWYRSSENTMISTQIGPEKIFLMIDRAVLDQAEEFQARFFELRTAERAAA